MHIVLDNQITEELSTKYIMLELDSFVVDGTDKSISAYCLVENVPLNELPTADHFRDLHTQLIKNYRVGNWSFCRDALEHLMGRWNGEVDSFYRDLLDRITDLDSKDMDVQHWDPAVKI